MKGAGQEYGRGGHETYHSIKHGKRKPVMISRSKSLGKKCVLKKAILDIEGFPFLLANVWGS